MALWLVLGAGCGGGGGGGGTQGTGGAPGARDPIVSPPIDLSSVISAVHFSYRTGPGGFTGGHDTYAVGVDPTGAVSFTPAVPSADGAGAPRTGAALRLETTAIARGAAALDVSAGTPAVDRDGSLWTPRGGAVEHLQNGAMGVEQSWVFPWLPDGSGDLTVRVRVGGLDHAGETGSGHHFVDPVTGLGVRYGTALWVDRLGQTTAVSTAFDGGDLVVTVPASVLEGSVYPAVLDPTIQAELEIDRPVATTWAPAEPAVAASGTTWLVAWADPGRGGLWATRVQAPATVLDPEGLLVTTGAASHPAVAAGGGEFLVLWTSPAGVSFRRVQASGTTLTWVDASSTTVGAAGDALASAAYDTASARFLAAWQRGTGSVVGCFVPQTGSATTVQTIGTGAAPTVAPPVGGRFLVAWATSTGAYASRVTASSGSVANAVRLTTGATSQVAAAGNGSSEWLVVAAASSGASAGHLVGRRVQSNGNVTGVETALTNATGTQSAPAITWTSSTNYVLAWLQGSSGVSWQWVRTGGNSPTAVTPAGNGAGTTSSARLGLGFGSDTLLAWASGQQLWQAHVAAYPGAAGAASLLSDPPTRAQSVPAVATDGSEYLVVWQDARTSGSDVYAARVSAAGALVGAPFAVAATGASATAPAVAHGGGDYLVVWSDGAVKSAVVNPAAASVSAPGTLSGTTGQLAPRVAYAAPAGAYLVAWTDTAGTGQPNVLGARVSTTGVKQGNTISIAAGAAAEQAPDVAASPAGDGWRVVWQNGAAGARDVYGALVGTAGTVSGTAAISAAANDQTAPAIGCGGGSCLVAWTDARGADLDVYAARLGATGAVLDAAGLAVGRQASGSSAQQRPAVAHDGRDFLVAFEDGRNGAAEIWGNRVGAAGATLDGTGVVLGPPASAAGTAPRLASGAAGRALLAFTRASTSIPGVESVWARLLAYRNAVALAKAGGGTGSVTSSPAGIACATGCASAVGSFEAGGTILLTATPDASMRFAGWTGDCTGTASTCTLTADAARSVTATFERLEWTLAVTRSGTGSGTVNADTGGLSCGATCSAGYLQGTTVTLTAAPAAGSTFAGWSGACAGTGACTVTMDAARSVGARFDLATHPVTAAASGSGTIALSPAGAGSCGASCTSFPEGTTLTLTATPAAGWQFASWSGDCAGQPAACVLLVDRARSATATFTVIPPVTHALSVTRTGSGTVTSTEVPPAIDCGATCSAQIVHGSSVTLNATPASGWSFEGWGGACAAFGEAPCTVAVNAATAVSATFVELPPPPVRLTVGRAGTGDGSVSSSPAGIACPGTCAHDFPAGAQVTLSAAPTPLAPQDGTNGFGGWSGGGCAGTGPCVVTMDVAKTVTATFNYAPPDFFALTVTNLGGGTVADDRGQVSCGADCAGSYADTTLVTLTAVPAAGATFRGWSGACSGAALTCQVTMDGARAVAAHFTYPVTVTRAGAGTGSVTSTPAGLSCGASCSAAFDFGTSVTLQASPSAGSSFAAWSGPCTGSGTCTFQVLGATAVTATFEVPPPQHWNLTVNAQGTGTGNVSASPAGVACVPAGAGCTRHPAGTSVVLTAAPSAGSVFAGWSGACSGTGFTCTVPMSGDRTVTATFNPAPPASYTLTVSRSGSGTGTVASDVGGIACGAACSASLAPGAVVNLTATPGAGSIFAGWSGACSGRAGCQVTMDRAVTVGAGFAAAASDGPASFPLATAVGGPGSGTVTADGGLGLSCSGAALCKVEVARTSPPTLVTLHATPDSGSRFAGWVDACSGTADCVLAMDRAQLARAMFVPRLSQLTVSLNGGGTVLTEPAGALACAGSTCAGQRATDAAPVTLTARADPGWKFAGWLAQECGGAGPCSLTPDRDRSVVAQFVPSEFALSVVPLGGGSVVGRGIDCSPAGGTCTIMVAEASPPEQIVLTAVPDVEWEFLGWSGGCGASATCSVTVDRPTLVVATFGPKRFNATVQLLGFGQGSVTGGGLTCSGSYTTCNAQVPRGVVVFDAAAAPGSFFNGWGGVCPRTTDPTCSVDFQGSGTVQAFFEPDTFPLQITVSGPGTVTGPGISCAAGVCTFAVDNTQTPSAAQVTLTAAPSGGGSFFAWAGACQNANPNPTCTITMNMPQYVQVQFLPP